jgi:phosphate butyryltransferase
MASNRTFDEIEIGESAEVERTLTADDLFVFAHASGNINPTHLPDIDWSGDGVVDAPVAPFMWVGSLISAVLGNQLPGPGTAYKSQTFRFLEPVEVGDRLTVRATVTAKEDGRVLRLSTRVTRADGVCVTEGEAIVVAPDRRITFDASALPGILVERHQHFDRLVGFAAGLPPLPVAVVSPDDANSLGGALMAASHGLITPILIGRAEAIAHTAAEIGGVLDGIEIIDLPTDDQAARRAVELVHEGRVRALMKGHLHTDTLLHHVVKRDGGLRTGKRLTHCFVMDISGRPTPVIISDAAINIAPDLTAKVDIVQNAIDLARAIGTEVPKVGVLSAVETVNPAMASSIDAAVLSKMAERGQITGGIVDGPLAMDNAIDIRAARSKGISSLVAGQADVLIAPNLEAGNMLAKELTFVAHAEAAGLVVGASVPIILTSRADDARSRLVSCALALLHDHWLKTGASVVVPHEDGEAAEERGKQIARETATDASGKPAQSARDASGSNA